MSNAYNIDGKVVNVGDAVSIVGVCVATSGTAQPLTCTIQPDLAPASGQFNCAANDCNATQHLADTNHPARSASGKPFGGLNDDVTVMGVVTAISGLGNTASLTITLKNSGLSISVPSGSCHSDNV